MDMRGKLLALVVFGLFAAALTWVAYSLQRAARRTEQELATLQAASSQRVVPIRSSREDSTSARSEAFSYPRAELMRTQVERLSARLDRLSELLEQKTADYDALKADYDKSAELLNEFLTLDTGTVRTAVAKPVEPDADKPMSAEEMLAALSAELRETRTELADLEKETAGDELHILELEDRQRYLASAASAALVKAGAAAAPALADLLSDRRAEIRRWAATVLGEIGPDAASAVDALHEALSDPDEDVGNAARRALRRIENP